MRNSKRCPKCQHNHILLIEAVPDLGDINERGVEFVRTQHIAKVPNRKGFEDLPLQAGVLSAAVCKKCGHTELFVSRPERIPVDGKHVRELVGPAPTGPFR